MTLIRSIKFTPELLITAPRRSAVVPNGAGTHGLFTLSTYGLEAHKEYKETRILKVDDASSTLFSTDSGDSDPQWLGDGDLILYQRSNESEETELWIANGIGEKKAYYAGKIPSSTLELKTAQLKDGNVAITFSAPTNPSGQIFNPKTAEKPKHTGREFTKHPVRLWDTWNVPYRYSLFYTILSRQSDGRWRLSSNNPINALKRSKIQYPQAPGAVLGETGSYVVGPRGIMLCTVDPNENTALTMSHRSYLIPLKSFQESHPKVTHITTEEYVGFAQSPSFSADGKLAAFVVCRTEQAMDSERGIAWFRVDDEGLYQKSHATANLYKFEDGKTTTWDRFPGALVWSHDNKALYIEAEDFGSVNLFILDMEASNSSSRTVSRVVKAPELLMKGDSLSSVYLLNRNSNSGTKLFLTTSSFIEPSLYSILDMSTRGIKAISSISNHGADLGLSTDQFESITFPGDKSEIQAHIVRPSFFDLKKKYPLALLVHGGPQSAWNNSWSTRWNAALWAEQGWVVLMPNPSGSTGFGLELAASVCGDWGGRAYRDIVKSVDYVVDNLDYVDGSRIIMGGGSYGGYMAFWIAGQPLAKRLKAIVSHDGIFHATSMLASDLIAGLGFEVGSELWDSSKAWEKWSPANQARHWETPMLIIHSERDYRCPINEGLAAYGLLQAKGVPCRFLSFEDEGHWVLGRENSLLWLRTVLGWFNHYGNADADSDAGTGVAAEGRVVLDAAVSDARFDDEDDDNESESEEDDDHEE